MSTVSFEFEVICSECGCVLPAVVDINSNIVVDFCNICLEAAEQRSYDKGYNEGEYESFEDGKTEGFELGKEEGKVEGYINGYAEGYKKGKQDGFIELLETTDILR
jgi:hypothetical protein